MKKRKIFFSIVLFSCAIILLFSINFSYRYYYDRIPWPDDDWCGPYPKPYEVPNWETAYTEEEHRQAVAEAIATLYPKLEGQKRFYVFTDAEVLTVYSTANNPEYYVAKATYWHPNGDEDYKLFLGYIESDSYYYLRNINVELNDSIWHLNMDRFSDVTTRRIVSCFSEELKNEKKYYGIKSSGEELFAYLEDGEYYDFLDNQKIVVDNPEEYVIKNSHLRLSSLLMKRK